MEQYFDPETAIPTQERDASTASLLTQHRGPRYLRALEQTMMRFSPGERLALYLLATLLCLSALALVYEVDTAVSVVIPAPGGSLTEGETGPARFINPLLATSQADQDLTALVYSGLMRALPNGEVVPDLAQSYSVSEDGRIYTFTLRANAKFQDGSRVTADDVVFTVQKAQDQALNSPELANWTGVEVSAPDARTVVFTLPHAYAPFIEDTTLGILPKHLWGDVSDEEFPFSPLNTHPIGSGPYKISSVSTDSTGAASRYDLAPFSDFALGAPYLSRISFVFYPDQDSLVKALSAGKVDAASGLSASDLLSLSRKDLSVVEDPLPRVFGVFYDQSHNPVLADPAVRQALDAATNKQAILSQSLGGLGAALDSPIPPDLLNGSSAVLPQTIASTPESTDVSSTSASELAANARAILQNGGWKFDSSSGIWSKGKLKLTFTLSTADQPALVETAHLLAGQWKAAGIQVSVQVYPLAQLNQDVIRPRNYDALLFGEVVGPQLDLYAFWHSSQRSDPGLNLALYANPKTDALLSQARATTDTEARNALYEQFASILVKDAPALFLYSPDFVYVVPRDIHGVELGALSSASDRFANVYQWYVDTQYVWAIFAPAPTN